MKTEERLAVPWDEGDLVTQVKAWLPEGPAVALHNQGITELPLARLNARHTFATLMLELGESPKTVQMMLGHSKIAITLDTYSHVSLNMEKQAAARLNAVLRG